VLGAKKHVKWAKTYVKSCRNCLVQNLHTYTYTVYTQKPLWYTFITPKGKEEGWPENFLYQFLHTMPRYHVLPPRETFWYPGINFGEKTVNYTAATCIFLIPWYQFRGTISGILIRNCIFPDSGFLSEFFREYDLITAYSVKYWRVWYLSSRLQVVRYKMTVEIASYYQVK
jgi:hypothetical protein